MPSKLTYSLSPQIAPPGGVTSVCDAPAQIVAAPDAIACPSMSRKRSTPDGRGNRLSSAKASTRPAVSATEPLRMRMSPAVGASAHRVETVSTTTFDWHPPFASVLPSSVRKDDTANRQEWYHVGAFE